MEVLLGIGCAVAFIAGIVLMFFGMLGDSPPAYMGGFGLSVGGLGFALDAMTNLGFIISMAIAMAVVTSGVIWLFKR